MPDCKFHWDYEDGNPSWRTIYRECHICWHPKTLITNAYSIWPNGTKHPEPPMWICRPCVEHANYIFNTIKRK